jgi:hypothetical protein
MGRTKIKIDVGQVEELAAQGLSQVEICATLGISEDTMTRRKKDSADFAGALERGKARASATISNKLFELAASGNLVAIRWWETTRRGMSDRVKSEVSVARTFEEFVATATAATSDHSTNSE